MSKKMFVGLVLAFFVAGSVWAADVFQEGFEGDIGLWKTKEYHEGSSRVIFETVSPGAKGSAKAYKINGSGGDIAFTLQSPLFPVEAGAIYELSFDANHNYDMSKLRGSREDWWSQINWYDGNGNKVSHTRIIGFDTPNTEWHTDKYANFQAPAGAVKADIQLGANYPALATGQYIIFDNITFTKVQ